MPRGRDSRSPERDRDRDRREERRSRSREKRREKRDEERPREKEKSRRDDKRRDPSEEPEIDTKNEDAMMQQMLGFSNFDTSKGKDHATSDEWMIKRRSKRKYRQYMNRRGGFNRPLDSVF
jgi:U4/U6.U5 tri-snRNP-associated protein 3